MEINKSTNLNQDQIPLIKSEDTNKKSLSNTENSSDEFIGHIESSYENNDNLKFQNIKIKFYPEDARKIKAMSFEDANTYRNKLLQSGKFTIINPEDNF